MKSVITSLILVFILPFYLSSQNFVDEEIKMLAEEIGTVLDKKNSFVKKKKRVKMVLVEDFTDTEGNISKLGAMLAEEFSSKLVNVAFSFEVTGAQKLSETPSKKNKLNFRKALEGATKIAEGVIDDSNYELNKKTRNAARSIDGANDIGASIKKDKSRYKGIDAVVTGTFTESNDQYRILIRVISTKKGNSILATSNGALTKTPFILKLEEEENKRRATPSASNDSFASRGGGSTRGGSAMEVFASNQTQVELLECKQVGQNIQVILRIKNIGPDLNFHLYGTGHDSRGIDSNNSYDYWATQVSVGDIVDNRQVKKTLITNNPVEAKVTFSGVARDVSTLAKVQVKCYGHGGYFYIVYRDVRVD